MKKLLMIAAIAFVGMSMQAQDNLTVKSSMKIEGLPEEYAGMAENEILTQVKGEKTKIEVSGMMINQLILNDGKVTTVLSDQMGNKTGYTVTKAEVEAEEKEDAKKDKPKIEYTTEKKTIAGYECTKAIVTSLVGKDKKEVKTNVWFTEKIKLPAGSKAARKNNMGPDLGELKGYPMQMEMTMNQGGMDMKMITTVTEVDTKPVDDKVFTVSTEGYKMMTYKEMKEQQKKQMEAAEGK
jgi:hypothetical protein